MTDSEEKGRGGVAREVLLYYLSLLGGWAPVIFFFGIYMTAQVTRVGTDWYELFVCC